MKILIIDEDTGTVYGYMYTVQRITETLYDQFEREDQRKHEDLQILYRGIKRYLSCPCRGGAESHRESRKVVRRGATEDKTDGEGRNQRR